MSKLLGHFRYFSRGMKKPMARLLAGDMAARGRIGGFVRASRYAPQELTAAARNGFMQRFLLEADPTMSLSPEERWRRARALLMAHMARLSRASALTRRKNGNGKGNFT